jgi:16S rRNA (cytosine1402-N4)-methyltransferase
MVRQQVFHQPVLVNEIVRMMVVKDDGVYCDCTVGGAGHLLAMIKHTKNARFVGIDCDPQAILRSQSITAEYRERCILAESDFIYLDLILEKNNIRNVNGVLFDLGVSYHQLTTPSRGFSFDQDGALLMRMSPETTSLRDKLRRVDQAELARVLRAYGDVRNYRKIARLVFEQRDTLVTTRDLRRVIEEAVPKRYLMKNLHKVFQALRIWTNDELAKLRQGLDKAFRVLSIRGRLLVISYHSGEDRIVKRFFRLLKDDGRALLLHKKVIRPGAEEINSNPSARSARLRVIEKCVS